MMKKFFVLASVAAMLAMVFSAMAEAAPSKAKVQGYVFTEGADDPLEDLPAELLYTDNLPKEKLAATSKDVLAYMRNRIYAHHGYVFKTEKWKDVFTDFEWYSPNPKFSEKLFNAYEKENIKRIQAAEKKK